MKELSELKIEFPAQLPVSGRVSEISAALSDHQVIIVCGETGSGKTTQLPKIALSLGRGRSKMIAHTQPRRIAARSVATRIAEELGVPLGHEVGFQVRFQDDTSAKTMIKVVTDGILLSQIQHDPQLLAYDTIIIDEAHERSLNIDFLLGYLARLLPARPDLKLVITSATIDAEKFAEHFTKHSKTTVPIIEVSGRTFPVEVRYRPLEKDEDQTSAIVRAVNEINREQRGDVLVFLAGEREIRDTQEALGKHLAKGDFRDAGIEILPLFARLSANEQNRIFHPGTAQRIILTTNVAETSLTVPRIKYVIDTGFARISRFSRSTKVQRLPIEAISQASANQRSGRCGRLENGVALRLYDESDYSSRPEFSDPEILRTSLAAVILHMLSVGVVASPNEIINFPFVDAPETKAINDGVNLLFELGALTKSASGRLRLTEVGKVMASLPLDPRFGRMVVAASKLGVGRQVAIIAAALTIQDPRERPLEQEDRADSSHRRFNDLDSDFITFLNLWTYLAEQRKALSNSAFRRMCKAEFLHYLRIREWQDVVSQIVEVTKRTSLRVPNKDAEPLQDQDPRRDSIHQALLTGLLANIGMQKLTQSNITNQRTSGRGKRPAAQNEYLGARGAKFAIFPGSALAKRAPAWVMCGQLVETSRLWGRQVAKLNPAWIEQAGKHLVKVQHSEPHWSKRRAAALVKEKVLLFGLPIVADRLVPLAQVNKGFAREMFIRHALIEGQWLERSVVVEHNTRVLAQAQELADRRRQHGVVLDSDGLFEFYDTHLGAEVTSGPSFTSWYNRARRQDPDVLKLTLDDALSRRFEAFSDSDFPAHWPQDGMLLSLAYTHEVGAKFDGLSVQIPLSQLNRVSPIGFDWLVPGFLPDLVLATIKALPKPQRVKLVPAPDTTALVMNWFKQNLPPWSELVQRNSPQDTFAAWFVTAIQTLRGVELDANEVASLELPAFLRPHFKVFKEDGNKKQFLLDSSDDLQYLQQKHTKANQRALNVAVRQAVQTSLTELQVEPEIRVWPANMSDLRQSISATTKGLEVRAFPGLQVTKSGVSLQVYPSEYDRLSGHRDAVLRLLELNFSLPLKRITSRWPAKLSLTLAGANYRTTADLVADLHRGALVSLVPDAGVIFTKADFDAALAVVRAGLEDAIFKFANLAGDALVAHRELDRELNAASSLSLLNLVHALKSHSETLVSSGFISRTPAKFLARLPVYLRADLHRLQKAPSDLGRDETLFWHFTQVEKAYEEALKVAQRRRDASLDVGLQEVSWSLEELRISLFAQQLRPLFPVSEKRILKRLQELLATSG